MTEQYGAGTLPNPQERTRVDAVALFLTHWRGSLIAVSLLTVVVLYVWEDYIPLHARLIWGMIAFGNFLAQAYVSWRMERSESLVVAIPRYMPWLLLSVSVSSLVWGSVPWLVQPPTTSVLVYISLFILMLTFAAAHSPSNPSMLICAVTPMALLNISALAIRIELSYAGYYLILIVLVLLYGLRVQAAVQSTMAERHAANDLAAELKKHQHQLVKMERENTLLLERQRLMYDMHDGLGSTLLSALAAIEQHELPRSAVAEVLRGCVDDLRMVIDSLEPMEHDLTTLLATIRYRLGQRLESAGLALRWEIGDLPELPWLEPPDALQILRLVQEALINVLKHAKASGICVATNYLGNQVEIHISDDGCGFDYNNVRQGRGLHSQMRRSASLGGKLTIDSAPGKGTSIRLRFPVMREQS